MDLREYLFRKRIKQTEFAKKVGVSRPYLSQVVNGQAVCDINIAKRISLATDNAVTRDELMYPEEYGQRL